MSSDSAVTLLQLLEFVSTIVKEKKKSDEPTSVKHILNSFFTFLGCGHAATHKRTLVASISHHLIFSSNTYYHAQD